MTCRSTPKPDKPRDRRRQVYLTNSEVNATKWFSSSAGVMGPQRLHAASFLQVPADLEQGEAPPIPRDGPKVVTVTYRMHTRHAYTYQQIVLISTICDMAREFPALRCRKAPSHTSNRGSCNPGRRGGGRKDDDVPQLATSEAEALR